MVPRRCERARLDRLFHVGIEPEIEFFIERDQWQKSPDRLLEPGLVDLALRGEARSDDLVSREIGLSGERPDGAICFLAG